MKKMIILLSTLTLVSIALAQSVDVKDSDSNTLMQINDEGTTGSVTLPASTAPTTTTNKLYNVGSTLHWNGSALGSAGGSVWSLNGSDAYYNTGYVGIGVTNPSTSLDVAGGVNVLSSTVHPLTLRSSVDGYGLIVREADNEYSAAFLTGYSGGGSFQLLEGGIPKVLLDSRALVDSYIDAGKFGVGTNSPLAKLHIQDNSGLGIPHLLIDQQGTGDAFASYHTNLVVADYSVGIDATDYNFKITNTPNLSGGSGSMQGDGVTLMQSTNTGIVDFNNQSRARAWLGHIQSVPHGWWMPIEFENISYDQQSEFTLSSQPNSSFFIAKHEGYYQINARTEFEWIEYVNRTPNGYVSIAVYVNANVYAQGNNLAMIHHTFEHYTYGNNAPNVSDVVHLNPGDVVEIKVWQNVDGSIPLAQGVEKTYVSIHKVS